MSAGGRAQSTNAAARSKAKLASSSSSYSTQKFRAAGRPAGTTSASMLGENRYSPNPSETTTDPFAPIPQFPDKLKMDDGNERSSSVSDNDDAVQANEEKPKPAPGKKTRGRVKIQMEYIQNKLRRYTTFSKRKSGIMKKAYELSTLTGTQVMLLVASETGHVYTFATPKLQPMITSEAGKALIQTCLHQPDPPVLSMPSTVTGEYDVRMSAAGFEETDLSYSNAMSEEETFKNNLDIAVTSSAQMPTILNPGPIVTIPHGMMPMPSFVTPACESQPMTTTMGHSLPMHPIQTLASSPNSMSPHHSPPSYSPPQQPNSPPRTYTPTPYPGSPSGTSYSQPSHIHPVMVDELNSPNHISTRSPPEHYLGHHGMESYDRSPSRSPIQHRYSPLAAPHGSPPLVVHSPPMRM